MPLSVANSLGGNAMSNLLRQTRPAKAGDDGSVTAAGEPVTAVARPRGRAGIDSTGAGTAQVKAALTVVLSRLGQGSEPGPERARAVAPTNPGSGASDALRLLDSYAADPLRLSA